MCKEERKSRNLPSSVLRPWQTLWSQIAWAMFGRGSYPESSSHVPAWIPAVPYEVQFPHPYERRLKTKGVHCNEPRCDNGKLKIQKDSSAYLSNNRPFVSIAAVDLHDHSEPKKLKYTMKTTRVHVRKPKNRTRLITTYLTMSKHPSDQTLTGFFSDILNALYRWKTRNSQASPNLLLWSSGWGYRVFLR